MMAGEKTNSQQRTNNMKANTTKETENDPMTELAGTALKNYELAFQTGLRLQSQAGRWWTAMVTRGVGTPDWQKPLNRVTGLANSLVPLVQERMQEVMALAEHNSQS